MSLGATPITAILSSSLEGSQEAQPTRRIRECVDTFLTSADATVERSATPPFPSLHPHSCQVPLQCFCKGMECPSPPLDVDLDPVAGRVQWNEVGVTGACSQPRSLEALTVAGFAFLHACPRRTATGPASPLTPGEDGTQGTEPSFPTEPSLAQTTHSRRVSSINTPRATAPSLFLDCATFQCYFSFHKVTPFPEDAIQFCKLFYSERNESRLCLCFAWWQLSRSPVTTPAVLLDEALGLEPQGRL